MQTAANTLSKTMMAGGVFMLIVFGALLVLFILKLVRDHRG